MSRISRGMERLDRMIGDLLDASLSRAGEELPLELVECDLDMLTREVAEEHNIIHPNRFAVISHGPVNGFWSETEIRRVVENLAMNAAKYSEPNTDDYVDG